jgi:uncharacterized protein YggE
VKTIIPQLLAALVLGCPLTRAFSQIPTPPPMISVSGSSEVKVAPDEIDLRVGVETRNEKLDDAKRENDERVSRALAFLKASSVEKKDVQTDFISIEPNYNERVSKTRTDIYVVRKAIAIRLRKVDSFESILTGLLSNGVTTVQGVAFRTSELRKYRDKARAMAIQAAREKADAMAEALGVKRGKVYSICANDAGGWWMSGSGYWGMSGGGMIQNAFNSVQNAGAAGSEDGALSVGQISVSASVNVAFQIEN